VFEHIDGALFRRAGMPSWTVTDTIEAYVDAAIRIVTQRGEREALRKRLIDEKAVERFFEERPEKFGKRAAQLVQEKRRARKKAGRKQEEVDVPAG